MREGLSKALIDGDIIAYAVSHACDGKKYEYQGEEYRYKHELPFGFREVQVKTVYHPEPWAKVEDSLNKFIDGILTDVDLPLYQVFLSSKTNHRAKVATILPYKGNRKNQRKPKHLDEVRKYLFDYHNGYQEEGLEADDLLGLHQTDKTCICSLDKDLLQIEGWHYNWNKQEWQEIDKEKSSVNFWSQMITGDPSDNILGLYGVGIKSAYVKKMVSLKPQARGEYVMSLYEKRFGSYAPQFFLETYKLLKVPFEK